MKKENTVSLGEKGGERGPVGYIRPYSVLIKPDLLRQASALYNFRFSSRSRRRARLSHAAFFARRRRFRRSPRRPAWCTAKCRDVGFTYLDIRSVRGLRKVLQTARTRISGYYLSCGEAIGSILAGGTGFWISMGWSKLLI